MALKKIVIIGPESTGKSTLCEELAAHYQSTGHYPSDWVPEYAREYLLKHGARYRYEDLSVIARGQLDGEDSRAAALLNHIEHPSPGPPAPAHPHQSPAQPPPQLQPQPLLFIDTDLYVMKVWSEFVFGRCEAWIAEEIGRRRYDAYLLCRTDLPWVKDELREYPDLVTREKLFHIYRDLLAKQATPWAEVGGQADQRLQQATRAVDRLLLN